MYPNMVVTGTLVRCSKARDLSTSDTPGCPTVEHQASPSEIFTVGNVIKVTAVLICCCCHYYNIPLFPYYLINLNMSYMSSTGVGNVPYTLGERLSLLPGLRCRPSHGTRWSCFLIGLRRPDCVAALRLFRGPMPGWWISGTAPGTAFSALS